MPIQRAAKDVPDLIAQLLRALPPEILLKAQAKCITAITENLSDEQLGRVMDILEKT